MPFCQSGIWRHGVGYGGSYITKNGACNVANTVTGGCTCPAGYSTKQTSQGGDYHYSPWDTYYFGYVCELLLKNHTNYSRRYHAIGSLLLAVMVLIMKQSVDVRIVLADSKLYHPSLSAFDATS